MPSLCQQPHQRHMQSIMLSEGDLGYNGPVHPSQVTDHKDVDTASQLT